MRDAEYETYLASTGWAAKRKVALEAAGHRCVICNTTWRLDVHHRTYERFGNEDPGDLTVLCRSCHEIYHQYFRERQRAQDEKRATVLRGEDLAKAIKRALRAYPLGYEFTTGEVAGVLGAHPSVVADHLRQIEAAGRIERLSRRRWVVTYRPHSRPTKASKRLGIQNLADEVEARRSRLDRERQERERSDSRGRLHA